VSHILAAVLTATPDWATLPVATPEPVRRLLRRCLERDKRKRLESAADAQLELDEALNAPAASSALVAAARRPSARTAWALAAVSTAIAVAVGGYAIVRRAPAAPRAGAPIRFTIAPPPDALLSSAAANDAAPALSPDGTMIVFGATSGSVMSDRAGARLWIRRLDSLDSKPLDGTDGAAWPFWSPDSRIIGFIAPRGDGGARLKTIDVDSGQIKTICESDVSPRGASWNEKGVIIFAAGPRIMRVAATGGDPSLLRQADASQSELVMRWPVFLPDGVHYLYSAQVAGKRTNRLSVASLDDDKAVFLREVDVNAAFANGYILFAQGNGRLAAQPFDPTRLTLTGGPRVIASDFARSALTMLHSHFSVSRGGVLEYQPASIPQTELVILDRNGNTQRTIADDGHTYLDAAISPDRRFIAFDRYDRATGDPKVWIFDLERNTAVPLTPGIVDDAFPAWSPDSSAVVFSAAAKDAWGLYRRRRGTSAAPELLASMPNMVTYPNDLSPDGRTLAYMTTNVGVGGWDVLGIDLPTGKASPLADGPRDQHHARYSPDGRWLAYGSRESGQFEVYVESTGSDKARSVVSVGGGDVPRWRSDGRELYYVRDETVFAVPVLDGAPLRFGAPVKLFTKEGLGRYPAPTPNGTHFDASPDGQWFVADVIKKPNGQSPINVIVNWPSMLKQ
jgi:Tol biopolymer transport system component